MVSKIKTRLAHEESGFTLIELLVVIVILGILVAIAVPSYLSFRGNAQQAAAESNVRSAIPAAEGYYQSNNGSATDADSSASTSGYSGMTISFMQAQAPGVTVSDVVLSADSLAYCIDDVNGSKDAYYIGGDQNVNGDGNGFTTDTGTNAAVTTGSTCADVVSG
jgi:type IV pilus assembly protein PilA